MKRIATINVDIGPGKPSREILIKLNMYVEGLHKKDKRYFIASPDSWDPSTSKTYITDEEAKRLLQRMIT